MKTDYSDWTEGTEVRYDPGLADSIPWRGISAFLEAVVGETTTRSLAEAVLVSVESLIPYDSAAFLISDAQDLTHPRLIVHRNIDESLLKEYIDYYIDLDPTLPLLAESARFEVDWSRYPDSEFTRDFIARAGSPAAIGISDICLTGALGFTLIMYRSCKNGFTTEEKLILSALHPHLHNLSSSLIDPFQYRIGTAASVLPLAGLTSREGEIAMLLRCRPTVAEIAERLAISRKTAAKHLESIYMKLGVHGKREAAQRLFHQ